MIDPKTITDTEPSGTGFNLVLEADPKNPGMVIFGILPIGGMGVLVGMSIDDCLATFTDMLKNLEEWRVTGGAPKH